MCNRIAAEVKRLDRLFQKYKEEMDAEFQKSSSPPLQVFPVNGKPGENYYMQMRSYLKFIANSCESSKDITELGFRKFLAEQAGKDEDNSLLERRFNFLKALKLIVVEDDMIRLGKAGVRICKSPENKKRHAEFFRMLLQYCEGREDYQFRYLLRGLSHIDCCEFKLKDWHSKCKSLNYGHPKYIRMNLSYDDFVSSSKDARGWLSSLGIVPHTKPKSRTYIKRGIPRPRSIKSWVDRWKEGAAR